MIVMSEGLQPKSNQFLTVNFTISLVTWLSLTINFVVHK